MVDRRERTVRTHTQNYNNDKFVDNKFHGNSKEKIKKNI